MGNQDPTVLLPSPGWPQQVRHYAVVLTKESKVNRCLSAGHRLWRERWVTVKSNQQGWVTCLALLLLSQSGSHTHTHTHTYTHTYACTNARMHIQTHSHTPLSLSLSLSLTHTHAHTAAYSLFAWTHQSTSCQAWFQGWISLTAALWTVRNCPASLSCHIVRTCLVKVSDIFYIAACYGCCRFCCLLCSHPHCSVTPSLQLAGSHCHCCMYIVYRYVSSSSSFI